MDLLAVVLIFMSTLFSSPIECRRRSKYETTPIIPIPMVHAPGTIGTAPPRCQGVDPALLTAPCCIVPPFFSKEITKKCGGAIGMLRDWKPEHNATWYRRSIVHNCDTWECILYEYHLLDKDDRLDDERFCKHLDRWVKLYNEFETVMFKAKIHCRRQNHQMMPINPCEVQTYIQCYRQFLKMDCPMLIQTPQCMKQAEHYAECRDIYLY